MGDDLLVLSGAEVRRALEGRELEIIDVVARAYRAHASGESAVPHSSFLRFPGDSMNRIIALPSYLGVDGGEAGLKWISSFPGNVERGLERASAAVLLNSMETGRIEVVLEGSLISARRTAASAALAVSCLHQATSPVTVGLVGCGRINHEVLRFLVRMPRLPLAGVLVHDLSAARAQAFVTAWESGGEPGLGRLAAVASLEDLLSAADLVSFATTAVSGYVRELGSRRGSRTILHLSLRDLDPDLIVRVDNVVDDVEHVLREGTSLQLAQAATGRRDFIRGTIGEVLNGSLAARPGAGATTVFSPFGLGILDLAVARLVVGHAGRLGLGTLVSEFWPSAWSEPQPAVAGSGFKPREVVGG